MTARLPVIVVRLLVLVAVWFLGTSTLSRAENSGSTPAATQDSTTQTTAAVGPLLVPDVRNLPYVFAKGVLEDAGLAWRVEGGVDGYAVDLVESQSVKPGTKLVDTGAPTIVLHLKTNPDYAEAGLPDGASPYAGTKVVLSDGGEAQKATAPDAGGASTEQSGATSTDTQSQTTTDTTTTSPTDTTSTTSTSPTDTTNGNVTAYGDVNFSAETTGSAASDSSAPTASGSSSTASAARPPAFLVPGAPEEPVDEMPLPQRAQELGAWLAKQTTMSTAATDHFSYQHAWIVTGAKFGWWHGAQALQTLIKVDQQLQSRFGSGASYLAQARAALADVLRKSKTK